jgi:hypothetical protein
MASIGIGAGLGAAQGALAGIPFASVGGPLWGALIGGALGAGMGAAVMLLNKPPKTLRHVDDIIDTTSIRNVPVGIPFGRNRLGGNWVAIGYFWKRKSTIPNTPGRVVFSVNAILALCEGEINSAGNLRQDSRTLAQNAITEYLAKTVGMILEYYRYDFSDGSPAQAIPTLMTQTGNGYKMLPHVPFRNTALMAVRTVIGDTERMPAVNVDSMGLDCTIYRNDSTGESAPSDQAGYAFYDSSSDGFYYTLTSSSATSAPFGLVGIGRQGWARLHTAPPSAASGSITHAWYLGRHDVLVMQEPADSTTFYIGWWGIGPTDAGWEAQQPRPDAGGPGYENAILVWYLDETHGILHTLHTTGSALYILRWTLLTGRIDRTDTNLSADTWKAMMYSADVDAYIVVGTTLGIGFVDPQTGQLTQSTTALAVSSCVGVCFTGQLVGILTTSHCTYWDVFTAAAVTTNAGFTATYGTNGTDLAAGHLGGAVSMIQNSYSGQVAMVKNTGGDAAFVTFIPSILEDIRDLNANGTSGLWNILYEYPVVVPTDWVPEPNFQTFQSVGGGAFPPNDVAQDWTRDWSTRTYNTWNLTVLNGNSSLAGAAWMAIVAEPCLDSARWGGGLDPKYFDLGSFEGLHAHCVGPMRMANPDGSFRYAERYKLDFFVDAETSLASFINDHVLVACQGFRATVSGIMRLGVPKAGVWPIWHFTDAQYAAKSSGESSFKVSFLGHTQGINRVRVQYRNVLNEYSHDFSEADDEWDINARGRVQAVTVNAEGCGRPGHADLLCKAILDQTLAGRRQAVFDTHFLGWLIVPTDTIEVSNAQCALDKVKLQVLSTIENASDGMTEITALEHRQAMDSVIGLTHSYNSPGAAPLPNPDGSGVGGCSLGTSVTSSSTVIWFNAGGAYAPGPITVAYITGAFQAVALGNYQVAGFDIVTRDSSNVISVVHTAPGSATTFATRDACVSSNLGQKTTFTQTANGPLGIRLHSGQTAVDDGSGPMPTFELCLDDIPLTLTMYSQAYNACGGDLTDTNLANVWILTSDVPSLPFRFETPSGPNQYYIYSGSPQSPTPGTTYAIGSVTALPGAGPPAAADVSIAPSTVNDDFMPDAGTQSLCQFDSMTTCHSVLMSGLTGITWTGTLTKKTMTNLAAATPLIWGGSPYWVSPIVALAEDNYPANPNDTNYYITESYGPCDCTDDPTGAPGGDGIYNVLYPGRCEVRLHASGGRWILEFAEAWGDFNAPVWRGTLCAASPIGTYVRMSQTGWIPDSPTISIS